MTIRLERINDLVRELSFQDDPERLVRVYTRHGDLTVPFDGLITVTRRDLVPPQFRITRSWRWKQVINPWTEAHLLPLFEHGLLGALFDAGQPAIVNRLAVPADDPAREHFDGMAALACAPAYDHGKPQSMVVLLRREPDSFHPDELETLLLNANLLSRAAGNLVLAQQLQEAYRRLDYESRQVGRMQRHLLPAELPRIDGLELGASYVTSSRAGGDYYDVLPLPEGRWGVFLADVSGHGTAAAVVMAILHTLLHAYPGPPQPPCDVLVHLNRHLLAVAPEGMFATAIYGVFDPPSRRLTYANAGHLPPRLRQRRYAIEEVPLGGGLPLGVDSAETWEERQLTLPPGETLFFYTDGLVEGTNETGEMFGVGRLDAALKLGPPRAAALVQHVERHYRNFCGTAPDLDDRTLLALAAVP